ncbi:MAG: hypothetical protein KatS3mg102_0327 [Planctomycetota bacterium]|nr:MAG: hypothetical protein KatS3mg102_0327 [Planctomycetota bacterium]
MPVWGALAVAAYFAAAAALVLYGANCYVMIALFRRRAGAAAQERRAVRARHARLLERPELPVVTTQIPIYNEFNVAARAMQAACRMRWAPGRHQVQVLDDSTDETRALVDATAARLRAAGHEVEVLRRPDRTGYKAGALAAGLERARGELIAVFDADFVPPEDFLLRTVPFMLEDPGLGLVQARWGHLNCEGSLLTRAQAIGIDGHFLVEQSARAYNGLFMNFNGTAGLWRRAAIEGAGGWQGDTLTEDLDLSYRAQLAGWRTYYVPDVVVPAEIPEDLGAFKSQQFRWAKGSIQTAKKLLPQLLRAPLPAFTRLQALLHLTHYLVHPLMLVVALLALPVLLVVELRLGPALFALLAGALALAMAAPSALYAVSQRAAYPDWRRRLLYLPALVAVGMGIAVSNTRAVLQALLGRASPFERTPKRGERERKRYRARHKAVIPLEVALGLYCAYSLGVYLARGQYLVGPFLALYAAGFLFVGLLGLAHGLGLADRPRRRRLAPTGPAPAPAAATKPLRARAAASVPPSAVLPGTRTGTPSAGGSLGCVGRRGAATRL